MMFSKVKQFVQEPWACKWQGWDLPHAISLVKQSFIWSELSVISFLNSLLDLFTMHLCHTLYLPGAVLRALKV